MKEFSQKHSVLLFWSTIVLFIISITLSICTFCGRGYEREDFGRYERKGIMQNGGRMMDGNGPRGFRDNSDGQNAPQVDNSTSPTTPPAATGTTAQ